MHVYICMHICMYIFVVHRFARIAFKTPINTYVYACVYIYVCIYIHMYIYVYMHAYT